MDGPRLVALGILTSGARVLMEQRPPAGPLPGLWQFPGGKVEFEEHPWDALRRELREELALSIRNGRLFGVYSHVYDLEGQRVHYVLVAYRLRVPKASVRETGSVRWIARSDLLRLPVVPGSRPIVADVVRGR